MAKKNRLMPVLAAAAMGLGAMAARRRNNNRRGGSARK